MQEDMSGYAKKPEAEEMVTVPAEQYAKLLRIADITIRDFLSMRGDKNIVCATSAEYKEAVEALIE